MSDTIRHKWQEGLQLDGVRALIVTSSYNRWVTEKLECGAIEAAGRLCREPLIECAEAAGALELPHLVSAGINTGRFDVAIALGCIIKGETIHDRLIGRAVIESLVATAVKATVPIGIGVLTVDSAEQAESRAGGALGNKGSESMEAALRSLHAARSLGGLKSGATP